MATLADLQAAIDRLLRHPLGAGNYQLVQVIEEKAYEAYVFGLCLRAARSLAVHVDRFENPLRKVGVLRRRQFRDEEIQEDRQLLP